LKGDEIIERVDLRQIAGMDEAHEDIADVGAMQGAEEKTVFAAIQIFG